MSEKIAVEPTNDSGALMPLYVIAALAWPPLLVLLGQATAGWIGEKSSFPSQLDVGLVPFIAVVISAAVVVAATLGEGSGNGVPLGVLLGGTGIALLAGVVVGAIALAGEDVLMGQVALTLIAIPAGVLAGAILGALSKLLD